MGGMGSGLIGVAVVAGGFAQTVGVATVGGNIVGVATVGGNSAHSRSHQARDGSTNAWRWFLAGFMGETFDGTVTSPVHVSAKMEEFIGNLEKHVNHAKEVWEMRGEAHIISAPFAQGSLVARSRKIKELKARWGYDDSSELPPKGQFWFDPDFHMQIFAHCEGMSKEKQEKRWLQIYTQWFIFVAALEGRVHMLCDGVPSSVSAPEGLELPEADDHLEGNAQHGEMRIAYLAGFIDEESGLHFESYKEFMDSDSGAARSQPD